MKTWKLRLAILLGILAAAYFAACVYVLVKQEDILFDPTPISETTPGPTEEVFIPVGKGRDQGELHARWVPAANAAAPTFLYLHGKTHNTFSSMGIRWALPLRLNSPPTIPMRPDWLPKAPSPQCRPSPERSTHTCPPTGC